jgi:hypothetical protein
MARNYRSDSQITSQIRSIDQEQQRLEPYRARIQKAIDALNHANGWEKQLESCGQVGFGQENHIVIGQLFSHMVNDIVPLLREGGLRAGEDFIVSDDQSAKAAAGAKQILINKNALIASPRLGEILQRTAEASGARSR